MVQLKMKLKITEKTKKCSKDDCIMYFTRWGFFLKKLCFSKVINQKFSRIFCNFFNIENRESLVYKKCKSRKQNLIDLKNQSFEDNQEHSF